MSDSVKPLEPKEDRLWSDPAPEIQGVLLSDAISFYINQVNLIEDSDPNSIKPASYGLRLGSRYYCNGKFGNLKPGEKLTLPSNSLTFVSMLEKLNVPLYMIGRFNLKIDLIYQGIILGTGPQVDPGYRGHLSCPLHNISNNDIEIPYGDRFATIDFVKTSKFPSPTELPDLRGLTVDQLYGRYKETGIPGYRNERVTLFPSAKLERKILDDYLQPGRTFFSSLRDFEKKFRLSRNINWGIGIALFAVLLTLAIGGTALWWNQYEYFRDLRDRLEILIRRDASQFQTKESLDKTLKDLETRLNKIEMEKRPEKN